MVFKRSVETWRIFIIKGSREILVKVVLFHSNVHDHSHVKAMPKVIISFNSHYLDLSKEVYDISVSYRSQQKGG